MVRDATSFDSLSTGLRRHAPRWGQHTAEVLEELGWDRARIAAVLEGSGGDRTVDQAEPPSAPTLGLS